MVRSKREKRGERNYKNDAVRYIHSQMQQSPCNSILKYCIPIAALLHGIDPSK